MPLYDFACATCGEEFEAFAPAAAGAAPCPACSAEADRRFSAPATPRLGLRGRAARESDARRGEREAARGERLAEARRKRREG